MHRIEGIEKALNLLDTYDGQLSKIARALGINRYSLRPWRDKRKKVCTPLEVLSLYQTLNPGALLQAYELSKPTPSATWVFLHNYFALDNDNNFLEINQFINF